MGDQNYKCRCKGVLNKTSRDIWVMLCKEVQSANERLKQKWVCAPVTHFSVTNDKPLRSYFPFLLIQKKRCVFSQTRGRCLLMVAASTTLHCLWTCRPPTYMYTNFTFCRTDTHSPVCVSDTTRCRWEGINLHSDSSVLQVTAQRSPLTHSSAGVAATASALIFNQTQTGRNWSYVCFFCWSCCQAVEFLEIWKKKS